MLMIATKTEQVLVGLFYRALLGCLRNTDHIFDARLQNDYAIAFARSIKETRIRCR